MSPHLFRSLINLLNVLLLVVYKPYTCFVTFIPMQFIVLGGIAIGFFKLEKSYPNNSERKIKSLANKDYLKI